MASFEMKDGKRVLISRTKVLPIVRDVAPRASQKPVRPTDKSTDKPVARKEPN